MAVSESSWLKFGRKIFLSFFSFSTFSLKIDSAHHAEEPGRGIVEIRQEMAEMLVQTLNSMIDVSK